MKPRVLKFSLTPIAMALSFPVLAEQNWGGSYFGAMVNQGTTTSKSENSYSSGNASPAVGWNQNQFKGNLFNSINSMNFATSFVPTVTSSYNSSSWGSGLTQSQSVTSGTILAGSNIQVDNVVLGGEVRVSFGSFGATGNQTAGATGNKYMSDYEGVTMNFTNYNSSISGITSPVSSLNLTNSVSYQQAGSMQTSAKYNTLSQLIARAGYSFGDVLVYGLGGAAYANVKATTSANITETASGTITAFGGAVTPYSGYASYNFYGQTTKNMLGPAVGLGMEWALDQSTSFRLEGQYYNLGKINVQGVSSQTSATYSVSQQITAYNYSLGIIRKF